MALGAVEELILLSVAERAQGMGEGRSDEPLGQPAGRGVGEAGADGQARLDPGRLVAEEPRDAAGGQLVLLGERADHLGLVERCQGARRGVGQEQQPLVLDGRGRALDNHWYCGRALLSPAIQTLEAVEDLEAAVGGRGDAQRQLGQLLGCALGLAWPKLGQASTKLLDGHLSDRVWLRHGSPVAVPHARHRWTCRRQCRSEGGDAVDQR